MTSRALLNLAVVSIVVFCAYLFWQNLQQPTHSPSDLAGQGSTAQDAEPRDEQEPEQELLYGLRRGAGRDLVISHCMPCHSSAIIAANHLTRDGWDQVITQMQKQNGMQPLPTGVRARILDYLETAQRPDDVGLRQGKKSPWANPLYPPNPLWK